MATALRYISYRQYKKGICLLMKARTGFKKAMLEVTEDIVRKEIRKYTSKPSRISHVYKGNQTLEQMSEFSWETVFEDVVTNCPTLTNTILATLTSKETRKFNALSNKPESSVKPIVGTITSIILYMIKPTLCSFQIMNSLQMWLSSTKREVIWLISYDFFLKKRFI